MWKRLFARPSSTVAPRQHCRPRLEVLEDRCLMATRIWDGGATSNNWTAANNWSGNVAPSAGDDLIFPAGIADKTADNNYADGTNFNSITFTGGGYNLRGNRIFLGIGGIIDSSGSSNQINNDIDLGAAGGGATPRVFQVNTGSTLFIDGEIRGGGELHKTGGGDLSFRDNNVYSGLTDIKAGRLFIEKDESLGAFNTSSAGTIIRNGATLLVNDQVPFSVIRSDEPITIHNGGTIRAINDVELRGNMATVGNGTLRHEGSAIERLLITGQISGSGGITITTNTNGEVWYRGSNTYQGQTTVSGKLRLDNADGNAIHGDVTVSNTGQLQFERSDQIDNSATVSVLGSGLILTNNRKDNFFRLEMTGGTIEGTFVTSNGGNTFEVEEFEATSSVAGVPAVLGGSVTVELLMSTHIAVVTDGPGLHDLVFSGDLGKKEGRDPFYLTLAGGGTTRMTSGAFDGTIIDIQNGHVNYSNDNLNTNVQITVQAGSSFSGIGPVRDLVVNSGGRVRPGPIGGAGLLVVNNDLIMYPGAILEVALVGGLGGSHGQFLVEGTVSIGGVILEAAIGPNATVGQNFGIITNELGDAIVGHLFVPLDTAPFLLTTPTGQRLAVNHAGGTLNNDLVVTLTNTPPRAPDLTLNTNEINEGGSVTATGKLVDPDTRDKLRLYVNWGDGSRQELHRPGRDLFHLTHRYRQDGVYTARFEWLDQTGQGNSREFTITVNNLPPRFDLRTFRTTSSGVLLMSGWLIDAGNDSYTASVDYGDGTVRHKSLKRRDYLAVAHRYRNPGSYTVTLTLRDAQGAETIKEYAVTIG
jgi:hypothetical protein